MLFITKDFNSIKVKNKTKYSMKSKHFFILTLASACLFLVSCKKDSVDCSDSIVVQNTLDEAQGKAIAALAIFSGNNSLTNCIKVREELEDYLDVLTSHRECFESGIDLIELDGEIEAVEDLLGDFRDMQC